MLATRGMLLAVLGVVCVMLQATGPGAAFAAAAYSMCQVCCVSSTVDRCGSNQQKKKARPLGWALIQWLAPGVGTRVLGNIDVI
jgi:hypothetical protein